MDISFEAGGSKFNYRVCAVIIKDKKILAMTDERSPYYYLPGGRVKFGETAENAVLRELYEELGIYAKINRPLWINQAFFAEETGSTEYHELCIYFLVDMRGEELADKGSCFSLKEGRDINTFEWLTFDSLNGKHFYPEFLKKEIFNLPESLTLRTETEL